MARSFITKDDDHGFWVQDSFLQIIAWGMVNAIDEMDGSSDIWPKDEFRDYIFDSSQGYFAGFTKLGIDTCHSNPERVKAFNDIIGKVRSFFLLKGDRLSPEELNSFQLAEETARRWTEPLDTKRILKVLEYLENVVNDRITTKASDVIDYVF